MAQYLLSVYQPVGPAPAPDFLEPIMRDVEALNREMKAAGVWVFGAGLHPTDTATVVRQQGAGVLITDGPFAEDEGAPRRVHRHRGGRTSTPPSAGPASWPAPPPCPSKCGPSSTRHSREWSAKPRPTDRRRIPRRPPHGAPPGFTGAGALEADIARVFREEYGRAVAVLTRMLGDIDAAEDAVQDAFTLAVRHWPSTGLPPSPAGWIITTARNRAIDRLRREAGRGDKQLQAAQLQAGRSPAVP